MATRASTTLAPAKKASGPRSTAAATKKGKAPAAKKPARKAAAPATARALLPAGAPLVQVLRKPIADNPRTRLFQETLDRHVDAMKERWDLERGLMGSRGLEMPHETVANYWLLSQEERQAAASPQALEVYKHSAGREGTAPLALAAFCWYSPLSRHHHQADVLQFFQAGLRYFTDSVGPDGLMRGFGLNGEYWAGGWDVEGLIYGAIFCEAALERKLLTDALAAWRRAGQYMRNITECGSIGNQRCVCALGLELYGQILQDQVLLADSARMWQDALPKVLDASGIVVEQHGPCMHYSYTAFSYAWLNLAIRGDSSQSERVAKCLHWIGAGHTRRMVPVAGPSSRRYQETVNGCMGDLLPAAEQLLPQRPELRAFVDAGLAELARVNGMADATGFSRACLGHKASPLMWAILMNQDREDLAQPAGPISGDFEACYSTLALLRRFHMKYVLVRHRYQTHYNFRDFLPFSGIQSWALGDELPLIHPTPMYPSTTRGQGLDTARQGTSHNWGLYGCGSMGIDGCFQQAAKPNEISFLIARYDWFWRLVFFTERSTVILEMGDQGPRETRWTLYRHNQFQPKLGKPAVRFAGSKACLYSTLAKPTLFAAPGEHEWAKDIRQLVYPCAGGLAAFAFSDDNFAFESRNLAADHSFDFHDAGGRYRITLHPGFFLPENPGNFSVDVWQLAHHGTTALRLE